MKYCTIADVLRVLPSFRTMYEDETISSYDLDFVIDEASYRSRLLLLPRFDIDTIESYIPLPPGVIYVTAVKAAMILLDRWDAVSVDRSKILIEMLNTEYRLWVAAIMSGTLLDNDNIPVPSRAGANVQLMQTSNKLDTIYESDRRLI